MVSTHQNIAINPAVETRLIGWSTPAYGNSYEVNETKQDKDYDFSILDCFDNKPLRSERI